MRNKKEKSLRALIIHPHVGSRWLFNIKVDKNTVRGFSQHNHPASNRHIVYSVEGYPKSCIKKIEIHEGEPLKKWDDASKC